MGEGASEVEAAAAVTRADGRRAAAALAGLLALALAAPAVAAPPTDVEIRAARQLFAEADKDETAGRWAEALDKLRRVEQVKLTAGVRSHVALCEEHLGQLAKALDDYTAAETQAGVEGSADVLSFVGKQLVSLAPRVPRLTIHLVPAAPDAVVTLDGSSVSPSLRGVPIPVDPGVHVIEATLKNRVPARRSVTLHERDTVTLDLELPEAPAPPPPAPIPPAPTPAPAVTNATPAAPPAAPVAPAVETAPASTSAPSRTGAWLATAGAVLLAGGGVAAYVLAGNARSTAVQRCAQVVSDASDACDSLKNPVRAWDAAAGGAWVGAAGLGTLAIILFAHHAEPEPSARLLVGPGSVGLAGSF